MTVKNCEIYFYLPDELPDRSQAVVVGRDSGRIIVEAFGRQWNLAMQCVDNGEEYFCHGEWLDKNDRRVRKALAKETRERALQELRKMYSQTQIPQ